MASVSPRFWFCMEWKPQKSDYYVCISIVIVIFVIFPFKFYTRIKINVCTTAILIVLLYSVWEKAMAPHSSTVARKIPWMEEPGGLQSMGSLRVGYDWVTSFTFHFHALEKEMATHSSVLAWRIPGMGEPGRLQSMGSHRVGHDWSDLAAAATY